MKTIGTLVAVAIVALALSGLVGGVNWSEQATTRADIAAQADIAVASRQAEAQMHAADRQAEAAIVAAREETHRAALWAGMLPLALIIVGATGSLWLILHYQARIRMHAPPPSPPMLEPPPAVRRLAASRGAQPALVDGQWHLMIDGQIVARVRQLQAPRER